MNIGLGLYREQLTPENLRFAKQAGATHIIAHLTNYFRGASPTLSAGDDIRGWGDCSADKIWTRDELQGLVGLVRAHELEIAGLENFSPRFWFDILLDGPEKAAQIEGLKRLVRDAGAVVDHVYVNFYYDIFPESKKILSDLNVQLHYLSTWWDVLAVVKKGGYLATTQIDEVEKFLHEPAKWSAAHGGVASFPSS